MTANFPLFESATQLQGRGGGRVLLSCSLSGSLCIDAESFQSSWLSVAERPDTSSWGVSWVRLGEGRQEADTRNNDMVGFFFKLL